MKNLANDIVFEKYTKFIDYVKNKFHDITIGYHPDFPYTRFNIYDVEFYVFGYTKIRKTIIIHYIDQFSLNSNDNAFNCKNDTLNSLLFYIKQGKYTVYES